MKNPVVSSNWVKWLLTFFAVLGAATLWWHGSEGQLASQTAKENPHRPGVNSSSPSNTKPDRIALPAANDRAIDSSVTGAAAPPIWRSIARLAYAQEWEGPMPPEMEVFRAWTQRFVGSAEPDRAALEAEGIALARARRPAMLVMIENDPRRALAVTVPAAIRQVLPAGVTAELEARVSGTGDLVDVCAIPRADAGTKGLSLRQAYLGGKTYAPHVYGPRLRQGDGVGISLHGVSMEGHLAVHESPLRMLELAEMGTKVVEQPGTSGLESLKRPAALLANQRVMVVAQNRTLKVDSETQLEAVEQAIVASEARPSSGRSSPSQSTARDENGEPVGTFATSTTGVKKVLVIRIDFQDLTGESVSAAAALDMMNNDVSTFYEENSYGKVRFETTVSSSVYRMPATAASYAASGTAVGQYTDAINAAGADFVIDSFDQIIVAFKSSILLASQYPLSVWVNAGFAIGGGRTFVIGEWGNGYILCHELGHNFGLHHAVLWQTHDGNPVSSSGEWVDYGDPFDVMGSGSKVDRSHFSPPEQSYLGWMPDSAVTTVTASGTYRVHRYDSPAASLTQPLALRVYRDGSRWYWVGLRQKFPEIPSLANGAYIVWGVVPSQSYLLDLTTPGVNAMDAGLAVGQTFTDSDYGISIRPILRGGTTPDEYLDVEVTVKSPLPPSVAAWGNSVVAFTPFGLAGITAVAAGDYHALALKSNRTVVAWGFALQGQLDVPAALNDAISVVAGGNLSGAIRRDGSIVLWGGATNGEKVIPAGLPKIRELAIGFDHVLALTERGTVVAWGANNSGQTNVPSSLTDVVAIAAGYRISVALKNNGTVVQWGSASGGTVPASLEEVVAIAAGGYTSLALTSDGSLVRWGGNTPVPSTAASGVAAIASHTLGRLFYALKANGSIETWGVDSNADFLPPSNLPPARSIAAGAGLGLALIPGGNTPVIAQQPRSRLAQAGDRATFAALTVGSLPLQVQWEASSDGGVTWTGLTNDAQYSGVSTQTLTLSSVSATMNGSLFRALVASSVASTISEVAAIAIRGESPVIRTQPSPASVTIGTAVGFAVEGFGSGPLSYQWRKDGVAISGATAATFNIENATAAAGGVYSVVVSNDDGSVTSTSATLDVMPAVGRLLNLSTRGLSQTGSNVLIPGFVVSGTANKRLLIRVVGPTLKEAPINFNGTVIPNPRMQVKRFDATIPPNGAYVDYVSNDDWSTNTNAAEIAATGTQLSAFALTQAKDAALLVDLAPGQYTVIADDKSGTSGIAIVELYDADSGSVDSRLVNISNRGFAGVGDQVMIPGFVVSSEGPMTLLVRVVGPTLGDFGVTGTMPDPKLTVYSGQTAILENDNWSENPDAADTAQTAQQVSAFSLSQGSKDAAFVVTLPPGSYTVVGSSAVEGETGVVLVEVYVVP